MNVVFPERNDSCVLDGDIWANGSTWWKNECEQCRCISGLSFCDEKSPQCPELLESCRVTQVPQGKCCPVCVGEFNTGDEMLGLYKYLLCFIWMSELTTHDSVYSMKFLVLGFDPARIYESACDSHCVNIPGKWPTWRTILFYVFILIFNSLLHVSSTSCSSSGETNCVNSTSGSCHSVSVAMSCAGWK